VASHVVLDNQGSYRVGEDGSWAARWQVNVDLEHAYALKARGKATFTEGDTGEGSVMKFMRTPSVCEVVLGLLFFDTIKLS
jgi:hypothetical protein